jgi:hypothetical protein
MGRVIIILFFVSLLVFWLTCMVGMWRDGCFNIFNTNGDDDE